MRFRRKGGNEPRRQPMRTNDQSSVFSYYASRTRSEEPIRRQQSQKQTAPLFSTNWVRNIPTIIALLIVVGGVLYSLVLNTNPKIITSALTPSAEAFLRDKQDYQIAAEMVMKSTPFNRNKLTIDTQAIADELKAMFPELADVSVTLPLLGHRPIIQMDATEPSLVLAAQSKAYVVDYRGIALMDVQDASELAKQLPVVTDESGLSIEQGEAVLSSENVTYITEVIRQLKAKGINPSTITLPPLAKELHVGVQGQPYFIKFNLDTESRVAVGAFLATKDKLDVENVTPREYIDVRIEERAYYR